MIDKEFKKNIHNACLLQLREVVFSLKSAMNDLVSDAENDSKSTAGDKHETGRAMMQQEVERLGKQLHEAEMQLNILNRFDPEQSFAKVAEGSMVETDSNVIYISVPLGRIESGGKTVFIISKQSPLAQALHGKRQEEIVEVNSKKVVIKKVL